MGWAARRAAKRLLLTMSPPHSPPSVVNCPMAHPPCRRRLHRRPPKPIGRTRMSRLCWRRSSRRRCGLRPSLCAPASHRIMMMMTRPPLRLHHSFVTICEALHPPPPRPPHLLHARLKVHPRLPWTVRPMVSMAMVQQMPTATRVIGWMSATLMGNGNRSLPSEAPACASLC